MGLCCLSLLMYGLDSLGLANEIISSLTLLELYDSSDSWICEEHGSLS